MSAKLTDDEMMARLKEESKVFLAETLGQLEARVAQLEHKYPQHENLRASTIARKLVLEMAMWLDGVADAQLERAGGDYEAFANRMKQMITRKLELLLGQRYGPSIQREGINLMQPASPPRPAVESSVKRATPRRVARKPRGAIGKRVNA